MNDPTSAGPVEMYGPRGPAHPHRVSGRVRRRLVVGLLAVLGVAGAAAGVGMLAGFLPHPVVAGDPKATGLTEGKATGPQAVKAIRPRRDPTFRLSTRQIATVQPFVQAGLRARVAGVVRHVTKDIGDSVRAGELLVEIDVPDLEQAVAQKDAVVRQRLREADGTEAELASARAGIELAAANVKQKDAEVFQSDSLRAFKQKRYDRIKVLVGGGSVTPDVVDEAELDARAAASAVESSRAAVDKARAEKTGKEASLATALADVEIKRALVEVARKDRDVAAAQLGYARLYAPFDGVVTARAADPGRFVANATTGASEPLVTVARVDLVTVVMKAPDTAAPFISPTTEVAVEFAQLPGVVVRGKVTRYSPVIDQADRTMRVEVDVYNGSPAAYRAGLARAAGRAAVAPLLPFDRAAGLAATGPSLIPTHADALVPEWGTDGTARPIVPGTTATMRVFLDTFADAPLLPAGAVFGKSGQPNILLVENGVTRAVPVVVQVSDGRLAKVAMVDAAGGRELTRELTGSEVVVSTRQVEIGEGTRVTATVEGW